MGYDSAFRGDPQTYERTRAFPRQALEHLLAPLRAALPRGARVLDLGTGTGRLARPLAAAGYAVWGLDLSARMLTYQREKAANQAQRPLLIQGDAHALPFADGAFRAVVTVHVLHLVASPEQVLQEVARVLAPDGTLWLGYLHHPPESLVGWTLNAWREALRRRGYSLERPGWRDYPSLVARLAHTWRLVAHYETPPWETALTPAQALDGVARRLFSPYQGLPEEEHQTLVLDLREQARTTFGDLTRPVRDLRAFRWYVFAPPGG